MCGVFFFFRFFLCITVYTRNNAPVVDFNGCSWWEIVFSRRTAGEVIFSIFLAVFKIIEKNCKLTVFVISELSVQNNRSNPTFSLNAYEEHLPLSRHGTIFKTFWRFFNDANFKLSRFFLFFFFEFSFGFMF